MSITQHIWLENTHSNFYINNILLQPYFVQIWIIFPFPSQFLLDIWQRIWNRAWRPVTLIKWFANKLIQFGLSFDDVYIGLLSLHNLIVHLEGVTSYLGPKLRKRCRVFSKYLVSFGVYVRPRVYPSLKLIFIWK